MSVLAVGGIVIFKKLMEEIAKDLYSHFKDSYADKIKELEALNNVSALHVKLEEISKVKTIWQTEKAVPLSSFYCNTNIKQNGTRKVINSLSDIESNNNILIEGIAGQGKSIFLRYLCTTELAAGKYIPIFIELRRLNDDYDLKKLIFSRLKELGFDINDEIMTYLCIRNRMLLLLDGFDEIPDKMHIQFINELEEIVSEYSGIRVLITSRPDSGLEYLPSFDVVKVDYLRNDEYIDIINKIYEDPESSKNLIEQIEKHNSDIRDLLCTPLMIALLVMTYKAYQKVPDQLSDFFESMFHVMLQRHDGTKPGFTRERKSSFNDMEFQRVFEALCFFSKEKGQSFKTSELLNYADKAIKQSSLTGDAQKYIYDVSKITCLILNEGEEYRFIHKCVQDYFIASFIKYKPDQVAIKFYSQSRSDGFRRFDELMFLEEIDSYRFSKYFFIPMCKHALELPNKKIPKSITNKKYDRLLKNTFIYTFENEVKLYYGMSGQYRTILNTCRLKDEYRSILLSKLYGDRSFIAQRDSILKLVKATEEKSSVDVIPLYDLHCNNICISSINEYAEAVYDIIHAKSIEAQNFVAKEEKSDFLF